jgi:hypothetical protein
MRSHHVKTALVTLASGAFAGALTLGGLPAALADPAPLAKAEVGIAANGGASGAVRPNPDELTIALTRATSSRPSASTSVARPNPDEQIRPTAPATIMRLTNPGAGFDWGDAAIGAGVGLALSVLSIASVRAVSRRRAARNEAALSR